MRTNGVEFPTPERKLGLQGLLTTICYAEYAKAAASVIIFGILTCRRASMSP